MVPLTGDVKRLWLSHAQFAAGYATDLTCGSVMGRFRLDEMG